ncbi:MAG: 30S ribosome-binding factor RbfA [Sedimentisphaerales bacterium]|nr:30S ribosome-binding factor RbfA [Sedimentisphaerales bacterium]
MKTRKQEKVARIIKESVSDCIANHLSDPRIEGLVSVTKVDISPDLRNVDVYISVFGKDEAAQNKTYNAIVHATKRIQSFMAHDLQSRFCPVLHFKNDDNFKKTLETLKLIDQALNRTGTEAEAASGLSYSVNQYDPDQPDDNPDTQIETNDEDGFDDTNEQ